MNPSHREIFERYVYAGPISRSPDAVADLYTEDGVYELPLMPARLEGREAIRAGVGAFQVDAPGTANFAESRYVLHETTDPDVFIAEIDAALDGPAGERTTMSLVQIFRVRDGRIAILRDYFKPI